MPQKQTKRDMTNAEAAAELHVLALTNHGPLANEALAIAIRLLTSSHESAISHAEAREIAMRFIDGHFGNKRERPRASIPADPERDDDLRLIAYIEQQHAEAATLRAERDEARSDARTFMDQMHEAERTVRESKQYEAGYDAGFMCGREGREERIRLLEEELSALRSRLASQAQ
jgi:hypothetical protein